MCFCVLVYYVVLGMFSSFSFSFSLLFRLSFVLVLEHFLVYIFVDVISDSTSVLVTEERVEAIGQNVTFFLLDTSVFILNFKQ